MTVCDYIVQFLLRADGSLLQNDSRKLDGALAAAPGAAGGRQGFLVAKRFPGLKHLQVSPQLLNIHVLDKLLPANEIIVTKQLPLVGPSRTQMLALRPQGAPQALNEGSFTYRNEILPTSQKRESRWVVDFVLWRRARTGDATIVRTQKLLFDLR